MQFWEKVIWSDEAKIELFRRNTATSVWQKNGTAFKKHNIIPTVKFGDGSILIWGCLSSKDTGELQVIHSRMNSSMYREIQGRTFRNLQFLQDMVGISCFNRTMIPSVPQNLQRNSLKIRVLVLSIGQVSLLTWIQLRISGILWRLNFISGIHEISSN